MKNIILLLFLIPISIQLQAIEKDVDTSIDLITLYLNGAEVSRSEEISLSPGKHILRFTGLSPDINPNSIQVLASDGVRVLSVSSMTNFLKEGEDDTKTRILRDSIEIYERQISSLDNRVDAFSQEKQMILSNKEVKGTNSVMELATLKETANYFRERIIQINDELTTFNLKRKKLNEQLVKTRQQLNEISSKRVPVSELLVNVDVKNNVKSKFTLRYLVNKAGWTPTYDLFTRELDEPILLKYKALAYNNSGIDWNDAKLVLSTADPNQSASRPSLSPWYLEFEAIKKMDEYQGYLNTRSNVLQGKAYEIDGDGLYAPAQAMDKSGPGGVYLEAISVNELSVDFEIRERYSLPSDGKPYTIDIDEFELSAAYMHSAIPKIDRDAFLLAQITGWEDLNLIEGPMNVYQGSSYVGLSKLDTRTLEDTLNLSLGRDKKVLVTRVKKKDFSSKKFLGSNKKLTLTYEINVKNNRTKEINIEVLDQIPISKDSGIEVSPLDISKGDYIANSGQLGWNFKLAPGASKKLTISFEIKYPKNRVLQIDKQRVMYAPRF